MKKIQIEKNNAESRKTLQNRENYFKIEKNVSELKNIFLQESKKILNSVTSNSMLFITQDKRINKRNLLHCVNSTFKLYVTYKGIKHQV